MGFMAEYRAHNSAVECHLHTVEVVGSNPAVPTIKSIAYIEDTSKLPLLSPVSLNYLGRHCQRLQKLTLRGPCFIQLLLRVQIQAGCCARHEGDPIFQM
jgi:hypothetical protein